MSRGGRVVVYMGDDQVNEFVYKFVSARNWQSMRAQGKSPLDEGTLYVARFNEDGSGDWLPLVHGQGPLTAANGFADQGDVLVKTRLAATLLGATPMDRPEWTAVDPRTGTVFVTLTNNSRGRRRTAQPARSPRPRRPRLPAATRGATSCAGTSRAATTPAPASPGTCSCWPARVAAWTAPPSRRRTPSGRRTGSGSTPTAARGSRPTAPSRTGRNNQMLVADAAARWDAEPEVRRFLTGVIGCEVTGIAYTPDRRALFVNLQHPGESGGSTWPRLDGITTPRSATVVITKNDGGVIGT